MKRIGLFAALMILAQGGFAATPAPLRIERILGLLSEGRALEVVAEQAIVKFSTSTTLAQRDAALASIGASRNSELAGIGWTLVDLAPGTRVAEGIDRLVRLPGVENAQPNHVYHPSKTPNDPMLATQIHLDQIGAFAGWEFETGGSNKVTIAVIDSGIQGDHPDLTGKLDTATGLTSKDCTCNPCANNTPPTATLNHGTKVAGVAAASTNNGAGVAGVSWIAQLISFKVFSGACAVDADDAILARAIDAAVALAPANQIVINLSLGACIGACPGSCPGVNCLAATKTAIDAAIAAKIPVIAAAGNYCATVEVPANCANVIPVGSVNSFNAVSGFSSKGAEMASGGVVAPGESIFSTDLGSSYGRESGTSFAAPQVSGLAALILAAKPGLTPAQVQGYIRGGADNVGQAATAQGSGRINVFRSVRFASRGTLADFDGENQAIAFPNPFRVSQTGVVSFAVPPSIQGLNQTVKVYSASGELVREVTGLSWDGKNAGGNPVATGTYVFVVTTDNGTTRGRMAVIR